MKRTVSLSTLVLLIGYVCLQTVSMQTGAVTAFVDVNVIPMDAERVLARQTVVIRDGKIAEIGPVGKVKIPIGAARVGGRGKYLMPGLIDMHAHLNSPHELPVYLANGVTTVYNLNGRPAHLLWRDRIVRGQMVGPTIYTCGPTIRVAASTQDGQRIVDDQSRMGYDSIKIYNGVSKEAYPVLINGAKQHNMLIVGHIPRDPKFEDVMKSGQLIAHAEEFVYTAFNNEVDNEGPISYVVKIAHENNVPVELTLVAFDHIIKQAESLPDLLARDEMKYLAPWVLADWQPGKNLYQQRFANPTDLAYLKKSLALQQKLAMALHRAGVRIMVGTDAMNMGVVPGFSVHEEIRNLIAIGFTPYEAFEAATRMPAEFLRRSEFGTVAPGKRADLLLVDGDPLTDPSRAAKPAGVMVRGRWLAAKELEHMLAAVPETYAKERERVRSSFESDTRGVLKYLEENDPFDNLLNSAITDLVVDRGIAGFSKFIQQARDAAPNSPVVKEPFINGVGYSLRNQNKVKEALEIFRYNVEAFPRSANTYDSLAETYLLIGDKTQGLTLYKKALEVDPNYPNAKEARDLVKKLEAELKPASPVVGLGGSRTGDLWPLGAPDSVF